MQLNNYRRAGLLDLPFKSLTDREFTQVFAELFLRDALDRTASLKLPAPLAKPTPWSSPQATVLLTEGTNRFWLKALPRTQVQLELADRTHPVAVLVNGSPSPLQLYKVLRPTLDNYAEQCKVLQVVGTAASKEQVQEIALYSRRLQSYIDGQIGAQHLDAAIASGTAGRLAFIQQLIAKRQMTALHAIAEIANDDRISRLSLAQQADYLRQVDSDKLGKALARRAEKFGLDFTETIVAELRVMKAHLGELEGVDDSEHFRSFYSQETTLEGLRNVCDLLDSPGFQQMEANDFLQVINIVGVACRGVVGDFPDPMTWRVEQIYPGCFISNSDIMMGFVQSQGQLKLRPPGLPDCEITATIPVFQDSRIQHFLQRHAPQLLEYYCSFGMRRVIAGVPRTYMYTVCSGLWACMQQTAACQDQAPSSLALSTLQALATTYREAAGTFFQHVLPLCLKAPRRLHDGDAESPLLSFYIANNGLTNMIDPLHLLVAAGATDNVPHILRAIYAFEVHQKMRKMCRERSVSQPHFVDDTLTALLSIDLQQNPFVPSPHFVEDPDYTFSQLTGPSHLDHDLLRSLYQAFAYADQVVYIPVFLQQVVQQQPIVVPRMTNELLAESLGLADDLSVDAFRAGLIAQALLAPAKVDRVDDATESMKIFDLHNKAAVDRLLHGYVREQYLRDFRAKKAEKSQAELHAAVDRLLVEMCSTKDMKRFIHLLSHGLAIPVAPADTHDAQSAPSDEPKTITVQIVNTSSAGATQLRAALFSDQHIPKKAMKAAVFAMARDKAMGTIWNNGNVIRLTPVEVTWLQTQFTKTDKLRLMWDNIIEPRLKAARHLYRALGNHHSHSNDKPSYFALGFPTLEAMRAQVSPDEFAAYRVLHKECCGLNYPPYSKNIPPSGRQRRLYALGYRKQMIQRQYILPPSSSSSSSTSTTRSTTNRR